MFKEFSKYTGFISNSLKTVFAYRFGAFIWMIFPVVFMLIQYFLWTGIFESAGGTLYSIKLSQYLTYIGIGYITVRFAACGRESMISYELKNGNVATSLTKPYDYVTMNFFQHIGQRLAFGIQSIPMIILIILIAQIPVQSFSITVYYIVSVLFAFALNFLFSVFLGSIGFWIVNVWGLFLLRGGLRMLFSGEIIAITFFFKIAEEGVKIQNFPLQSLNSAEIKGIFHALGVIAYCLPFQAMFNTPSAIYSGMLASEQDVLLHLGLQVLWIVVFLIINKVLWKKALNRVTIFGG
jgi:ABC-2 type transport system permease protein